MLTRFEPSVLRASAMAGLTATAVLLGRPASAVRVVSLAVAGAVIVDPLVVHALGFRLSVAATAGIATLAGPLAARLPGPGAFRSLLGVTLAAQVGVLPVAVAAFGGLPLASVPANVLAVPAAAPLTTWGLTGGLVADAVGAPFDAWLRLPTVVLTHWIAGVAHRGAALPLGQLRARHLAGGLVVAAFVVSARWSWRWAGIASTRRPGRS
jgi:competence protein ComEC